jgi:hypothetical protein
MHKRLFSLMGVIWGGLFFLTGKALAVCPVCTIAVGAGVGFSRWLGIDDTVTGLWIGGLTVSMIIWTLTWLDKKAILFRGRTIVTTLAYFALIVLPLYPMKIIGHPYNKLWGMDKLLLGILIGSLFFFLGAWSYNIIKEKRGQAHFPFQKVVMPIFPLIILSIIFYFLTI